MKAQVVQFVLAAVRIRAEIAIVRRVRMVASMSPLSRSRLSAARGYCPGFVDACVLIGHYFLAAAFDRVGNRRATALFTHLFSGNFSLDVLAECGG
jgi:hypothetical protein